MASYVVRVERQNWLNAVSGQAAYTALTTPVKVALVSVAGSETAAGTEDTGGSYARQSFGPAAATSASPAVSANSASINFTNMPALTTVGVELWDSAGTPVRKAGGDLTSSKTTASGDTLSFAIGALALNF
jgi:hypothetical protein